MYIRSLNYILVRKIVYKEIEMFDTFKINGMS